MPAAGCSWRALRRVSGRALVAACALLAGIDSSFVLAQERGRESAAEGAASSCGRDLRNDIAALVNGAPVTIADFKVGTNGVTDPALAAAFGVGNDGRRTENGLEFPSEVESLLTLAIRDNPCYRSFERVRRESEAEQSGVGRAVLQIQMPMAKTHDLTVEYQPGKFRRNVLLEVSFGFEVRDAKGKVVFATASGDRYRRTCFREGSAAAACLDGNGRPIDVALEWRELMRREIESLLVNAGSELAAWRALLESVSGAFYDRRYSTELEVTARVVRNREELALPYLFVQTPVPRLHVAPLLAGMSERGLAMSPTASAELENHYNTLFRSLLDRSLRRAIAASGAPEDARIVLLSDAQSAAFREALTAACAEQSRGFNRDDCLEPVYLIERLCDARSEQFGKRNPRGDVCLLASLAFNAPSTVKGEALRGVRTAREAIAAASVLRVPDERGAVLRCAAGDSQANPGIGLSDEYLRFDGASQNDDALYLMDAAVNAMSRQSDCVARHLVERYTGLDKN